MGVLQIYMGKPCRFAGNRCGGVRGGYWGLDLFLLTKKIIYDKLTYEKKCISQNYLNKYYDFIS